MAGNTPMKNGGLESAGKAKGNFDSSMGRQNAPYNEYEMQENLRVQEPPSREEDL